MVSGGAQAVLAAQADPQTQDLPPTKGTGIRRRARTVVSQLRLQSHMQFASHCLPTTAFGKHILIMYCVFNLKSKLPGQGDALQQWSANSLVSEPQFADQGARQPDFTGSKVKATQGKEKRQDARPQRSMRSSPPRAGARHQPSALRRAGWASRLRSPSPGDIWQSGTHTPNQPSLKNHPQFNQSLTLCHKTFLETAYNQKRVESTQHFFLAREQNCQL